MDRPRHNQNPQPTPIRDRGFSDPSPDGDRFPVPKGLAKDLASTGRDFLVDILGAEVQRRPENVPALTTLSQTLAQSDRRLEGLAVDRRLADLEPKSPIVQYNLACSQALNQDFEAALVSLRRATELGFHDAGFMASDPDLENLHPLNSFRKLVEELAERQPTRPEQ